MSNSELAAAAKARGNAHFQSKNWEAAIEEYSKAIELDPNGGSSHTYYSNRSACYAGKEDYENALKDGEKCVELKPDFAKGYSRVGLAHFKLGKFDDAKAAYQKGLEVDPNNASLKSGLDETERAQSGGGGPGAGGGLFGPEIWMTIHNHPELKQYASDPQFINNVKMLQSNAQIAMQAGILNDPKIKKLFEVMLGARFGMAEEEAGGGGDNKNSETNMDANENDNENDIEIDATENDTNMKENNRNNVSEDTKQTETKEKEDEFAGMTEEEKKEYLEEKEKKAQALEAKNRGNALYKEGKLDEAIAEYIKAQELDPKVPAYYLNQSAVLFSQEKWDDCIEVCKRAIEVNTFHSCGGQWTFKAYHRMGRVEEIRKNYSDCIKYYKNALLEESDSKLRKHVKDLENWLRKKEAKEYVDPAKSIHHKEEGNKLFKNGKFVEAIDEYSEAIKRNPKDPKLYSNRATAYCKVMRWDAAMEDIETCLKLDSKFVKAWIRKGKIQHVTKQYHKALESYRKAEELDPTAQDLIRAKQETLIEIQKRNMGGEVDEKARQQALQDPEVQAAMNDPEVSSVLLQAQSGDPSILMEAMRKRPHIAKKIETLIAAGVLQVR